MAPYFIHSIHDDCPPYQGSTQHTPSKRSKKTYRAVRFDMKTHRGHPHIDFPTKPPTPPIECSKLANIHTVYPEKLASAPAD